MKAANSIIIPLICIGILTGCGMHADVMTAADEENVTEGFLKGEQETEGQQKETEDIYVYVCGFVKQPGVYRLAADSRVCDALKKAGGVSEDGKAEALNQAECMTDGQTIYVPGLNEEQEQRSSDSEDDGLLNINTATKEEFMNLPGIGESKAVSIIQYREEHGVFQSIEELMEIPGIKEGVFNKIKESIKISMEEGFMYKDIRNT